MIYATRLARIGIYLYVAQAIAGCLGGFVWAFWQIYSG